MTVGDANVSDARTMPAVLDKARSHLPWLRLRYLPADRGYDSTENHRVVLGHGITPVIHVRELSGGSRRHGGVYSTMGSPTCLWMVTMYYILTGPETGHHLFRCPAGGCKLKRKSTHGWKHCDQRFGKTLMRACGWLVS